MPSPTLWAFPHSGNLPYPSIFEQYNFKKGNVTKMAFPVALTKEGKWDLQKHPSDIPVDLPENGLV